MAAAALLGGAVLVATALLGGAVLVATAAPRASGAVAHAADARPAAVAASRGEAVAVTAIVELAAVALEDPGGRRWELGDLAPRPAVVVVADRAGAEQATAWGSALAAALPDRIAAWPEADRVTVVSVADLRVVPRVARPLARWIIARLVAEEEERSGASGPPLLLDWDGDVAAQLGASPGVATIAVLDGGAALLAREAGDPTPERLAAVVAAIAALLARPGVEEATEVPAAAEARADARPSASAAAASPAGGGGEP